MTPLGFQTPTTTPRSSSLRRPLQSPFSLSPLAHHENSPNGINGGCSTYRSPSRFGLSERHISEITTVFQIFDPTLSGHIDIVSFEVMVRSLGFRMTRIEIVTMLESIWEERLKKKQWQGQQCYSHDENDGSNGEAEADAKERRKVDLSAAIQVLSQKGYAQRNSDQELRMYFRIFDKGNKGYITLGDLQQLREEVRQVEDELQLEITQLGLGSGGVGAVGDSTLQAMIEEFDRNSDGVIDLEEFRGVLEPLLSSSPQTSS